MKHKPLLLFFSLLLVFACSCQKEKKTSSLKEENIVISDSANIKLLNNDFSINTITAKDGLISNNILRVLFKGNSTLCLAPSGIIRIDHGTGRIVNHTFVDKDVQFSYFTFSGDALYLIDKEGLYKFIDNKLLRISRSKNIVPEIFQEKGNLFYFTESGDLFNVDSDATNAVLTKTYTNRRFRHLILDENEKFLCSDNTIYRLNDDDMSLTRVFNSPDETINHIIKDGSSFYFGSRNLYSFNTEDRFIKKITALTNDLFITYLYKENDNLYVGKNKGLILINLANTNSQELLKDFAVKDSYINHIARDENTLWISTRNDGLIKYIR
ncbi:MAG: hypothetical protein KKH98_11480 [Spirochaetes bacterium]|nr:hypothetical protein [Spirochaetota bacterium]